MQVAGAALAANITSCPASAAAGRVRFGVRTPFPPNISLRERAMLVKRIGFDGIELGREWLDKPLDVLQKELDGTGVAVSAIVGSIELLNVDAQKRAHAIETDRERLQMPSRSSGAVTFRVPFHHGTTFQIAVTLLGISACRIKLNIASAVGSSLSRLMKPEPARMPDSAVIGPGFSKRKST
jgi:hypothetical protein